jgi:hypothetical protein
VKYVPAEVLAFFIPATALATDRPALVIIALGLGLLCTPLYLYSVAPKGRQRPAWWFYPLATLAFGAWAVGASPAVSTTLGLDQVTGSFILLATVLLIPAIDRFLGTLTTRSRR